MTSLNHVCLVVSQLREKSGSLSDSVSFLNLNQNVANATTNSDSSLDPPTLNSMRNEQHRSAYNSEPSNAPAQHDSNLTVSGSRHKPYNQTTENFSAVISFAQSRCLICRKVFQSRKNLVHHARIHHRDLLLKVNGSRSLAQMAAHPFPCKICGHTFQWRSSLWRHTKEKHSRLVHSSINTIDDFNSSYQSSFLDSLQGSLAMQDDKTDDSSLTETSTDSKCQVAYSEPLKPFSCDYCSVRFSTPKARRKHVKSKHPENYTSSRKSAGILLDLSSKEYDQMLQQTLPNPPGVYPCPDCGAEFRIKSSMISHRARKHNNASVEPRATSSNKSETSSTNTGFSCSVCGQTFPLMLSLKVHASKKHGRPKTEKPSLTLELKPEVKIPKPPTTVANHNYETKSASRARAFVNKQHSLEIPDKVVATSEAKAESPRVIEATSQRLPEPTETYNEHSYTSTESSKIVTSPIVNSTSSKSKSRTPQPWVNPRLAEYMQICDLDTFTCSICDLSFDDRKKLFLHLNRVHLSNNSNHSNSTLTISSIKKEIKEVAVDDAIDLNDVNVSSGSAGADNSQPQAEVSSSTNESSPLSSQSWSPPNSFSHKPSSRKIRNYSKICNFETLSCKLCPRMCNTMSQLQNHAVYKHMDMIELVPMRDETHFGNQSSENSSNHLLRVNSPVEEQSSLDLTNKKQDDSRILGLSMTGVKRFPKPGDKRPFDCTRVIDENQNAEEEVARKDNEGMAAKKHSGSKIRVK